jgi:hypothetical protein
MRKTILLIVAASFILLLAGCGAMIGESPTGVTGGSDNGYGSLGSGSSDDGYSPDIASDNPEMIGTDSGQF